MHSPTLNFICIVSRLPCYFGLFIPIDWLFELHQDHGHVITPISSDRGWSQASVQHSFTHGRQAALLQLFAPFMVSQPGTSILLKFQFQLRILTRTWLLTMFIRSWMKSTNCWLDMQSLFIKQSSSVRGEWYVKAKHLIPVRMAQGVKLCIA